MRWKKELVKDKAKRRKYIVSVVFLIPGCVYYYTAQNHWTTANNSQQTLVSAYQIAGPAIDRARITPPNPGNTFVLRIHFSDETDEKNPVLFTPDLLHAQSPCCNHHGGPGSGKGTQCEKIVNKYGYTHLSSGDLLRDEVASGSERGKQLTDIMQRGELVPLDVVLDLLKEAMLSKLSTSKGYLIDGYPREVAQGIQFESEINPCALVIYFEVSDDVMTARLMNRGLTSGRVDDNEETIRKRLDTFHKHSLPVVEHYGTKCRTISAEAHPDEVFQKVSEALETLS